MQGTDFLATIARRDEQRRQERVVYLSYEPKSETVAGIISEICKYRGITREELVGPNRARKFFRARAEIAYWLRRRNALSFRRIGEKIGRDHTGAIYCVQSYCRLHGMPMEWKGVNTRRQRWHLNLTVTLADVDARTAREGK